MQMSKNIKVNVNTEINKIAASLKTGEGGGSKTDDYNKLKNKPTINGVEIVGDLTSQELGINEITAEERQKIQSLDSRFAELDSIDVKLENAISDLEDRADGVDNELDGIDQNIVTMQSDISANSTDINSLKNRVSTAENDIDDLESNMEQAQADISTNTTAIFQRALTSETAKLIEQEINSTTYVMTTRLKDKDGNVLSSANIDLPLESMVVNARFDSTTRKIVLVLQNGTEVSFSVADLVSGLQSEITSSNKLSSDLVDDTDHAHKFVSNTEKDTWNAKYDKASTGIPKSDLSSGVQNSLSLADTALQTHQDISGKEDKSNKITAISSSSTNEQYPSAKAVYDHVDAMVGDIESLLSNI